MPITKEEYDTYAKNSFFVDNNFSGRYAPSNISSNMIPCNLLQEFHYQTSFFLNFYSSLYIELQYYQSNTASYNVSKFANTIENMGIIIDTASTVGSDFNLSTFSNVLRSSNYDFTFFLKRFEEKTSNQDHLYAYATPTSSSASYFLTYSNIIEKSKPNFGSYPNILIPSNYSNNLILKSATISTIAGVETPSNPLYLTTDILTRLNSLSSLPETSKTIKNANKSKFKEIIEEIFSQKPENIIGYLLYKKIYYNIILYNIAIQNSIRNKYLNISKDGTTFSTDSNYFEDIQTGYNSSIIPVRSQIILNTANINELSRSHFVSNNNDFLLEKNEYRNKINALNTLKEEYNKIQDKLNISTKLYNQQFKNYKTIKFYATYVIIALIIIIILTISLSIFPIFSVDVKNSIYIISLIVLILITYLYYTNFKYVNLYEKFTTYHYIDETRLKAAEISTNASVISTNSGYIVGNEYNVTISGSVVSGNYNIKAVAGNFVTGYYKIIASSGFSGGSNYEINDRIEFNGNNTQAIGEVTSVNPSGKAIQVIRITTVGSSNFDAPPIMIIKRGIGANQQIINNGANFPLNFGKITSIRIYANTVLYSSLPSTITIANPDYDYDAIASVASASATTNVIPSGLSVTAKASRVATITTAIANLFTTTSDLEKYRGNSQGGYSFNSVQVGFLNADKTIISSCGLFTFSPTDAEERTNHAKFYTQLLPAINQYNNAYNDLMNNIRMNMYTIGSKTFSQDANIYLYNLYLEKKRQNENNKIKYTNLFNMIEIIKKQINFLFNIVFILGCFCIILLLGLVLYSTTPELYIFIIILCVILISILMIYFGFAIIQPTRMIVNKNYWAIVNPSKTAISKL